MGEFQRLPFLIELQTFFLNAICIVNDRPLTSASSKLNDLSPLTSSCFSGQWLAPYTLLR